MMNWYLLWKYKHWIAIAVLSFTSLWMSAQLNKANVEKAEAVAKAVKPYLKAIEEAKADAVAKEKIYNDNLLKAEQNAIEKIKVADDDADRANTAANSLSKQLEKAKRNMSTAPTKTIIEYVEVSSDVLEHCIAEYRTMAKSADAERIDKERLMEAWPSE